jgi:uncharacterized protein YbaA (DUF1428 family)
MTYVDGYVIPVPNDKKEAYLKLAQQGAAVFKKHGAVRIVECWGDDVPEGKLTSFPMAVKRGDDEAVVFSWIEWKSKKDRDDGMKAAMEDLNKIMSPSDVPFDGKRMIFGGFEAIVDRS